MLKRLKSRTVLIKVVTWILVLGLSGVEGVAQAATTCNTTSFEGFFLAPDGKSTIALTKQALSWEAASTAAKAEGARLIVITNEEQNTAVFSNLSSLFTGTPRPTSTVMKKAWIDLVDPLNSPAWSVEGGAPIVIPSRFSWVDDFSSYANWATGQPDGYCTAAEQSAHPDHLCYGEPWAAINSNGKWSDEGNHSNTDVALKGVVEWPNTALDCVIPVSPPTESVVETLPGAESGAQWCTDSSKTIMTECVDTVGGGKACKNDQVACNAVYETPTCPEGTVLDAERDMCQAAPTVICGEGYSWDASLDRCIASATCSEGGVLNPVTDQCEKLVLNVCPTEYTFDGNAASPTFEKCVKAVECANGGFNLTKDRCESAPEWTCPTGFSYNASSTKCEALPYCAAGTSYRTVTDRCEAPLAACPTGYSYSAVLDKCVVAATCLPGGSLNGATDKCESNSSASCPSGTSYNASRGKCESVPVCAAPGTYSSSYDLCLTPTTGTICPSGYSYLQSAGACVSSPSCVGGTYSIVSNRCESSPSYACSDSSYSYSSSKGRCEKIPGCGQGTYSSTYNVCLQSVTNTCPSGYNLNSTTGRCERIPVCPSGTTFSSVTNRCETSATSISAYAQPTSGVTSLMKYKARGDTSAGISQYSAAPPALDTLSFEFIVQNGQVVLKQECAWGGSGNCGNCATPNWNSRCRSGTELTQTRTGDTLTVTATIFDLETDTYSPYCDPGFTLFVDEWSTSCRGCESQQIDPEYGYPYTVYNCEGTVRFPVSKNYTTGATASADLSEFLSCPVGYTLTAPPSAATCTAIVSQWGVQTGITDCAQAGLYTCAAPVNACSSGLTLSGTVCYQNPTCPGGSFDYGGHVCYTSYTPTCPAGTVYDSSIGSCIVAATCNNGLLDGNFDVCYQASTTGCPSGYSLAGSICVATAACAAGGTLDGNIDYCSTSPTWVCPTGYSYSSTSGQCYQTANCGSGSLSPTLDVCQQSYSLTCPSGYALNGTTCQATPTCAGTGAYDVSANLCSSSSSLCGALSFDAGADKCYQAASCTGGLLNVTIDNCQAVATANCGTLGWDSTSGVCYSSPVCSLGAYDAAINTCVGTLAKDCGSYSLKDTTTCQFTPSCSGDPNFSLNGTVAYTPALDKCISSAQHDCVAATTYVGLPIKKCEAVPFCANGMYFPSSDTCYNSQQSCPLGEFQCQQLANDTTMAAPGVPMQYCSPNQCQSDTSGWSTTNDTESGLNDKLNDGARGADGSCLGQIYLYNGTDMRCRLADRRGMAASYLKLIAQVILTATGAGAALAAALAVYGQAAVLVAQALMQVAINTSIDAVTTGVDSGSLIQAGVSAIVSGVASGLADGAAGATSGLGDAVADGMTEVGLSTGIDVLADPALADVVQQIGNVVSEYQPAMQQGMLGNYSETKCCFPDKLSPSCKSEEMSEAKLRGNGACHVVGSYCSTKTLSVCMVKKQTSCCFTSKLGRIFHEQGRPQLTAFGEDGGWGLPRSPNCRGFTPEEFQMLNFGAMDLTEYELDMEARMDEVQPLLHDYMDRFGTLQSDQLDSQFNPAAQ